MTREIWTAFPTFTSIRPAISMARPTGAALMGTVRWFELTPKAGGGWTEKVLLQYLLTSKPLIPQFARNDEKRASKPRRTWKLL